MQTKDKKIFISIVGDFECANLIITEADESYHKSEIERCQKLLAKDYLNTSVSPTFETYQSKFSDMISENTELFVVKDKSDVISMVSNNFPELFIHDAGIMPPRRDYVGLQNWSKGIISELPEAEDAAKEYLQENYYKVIPDDDIKFELTSNPVYAQSLAPQAVGENVSADVLDRISELVRKFGSWQPILDHLEKI